MNDLHKISYSWHPGNDKMITMIKKDFFCLNMKKKVAEYLACYIEFQQVKAEHQHTTGLLHPLPILEWK